MRFKIIILIMVFSLFLASASAHPGRTDSNGGHYCWTNCEKWGLEYGEYHYHNGGITPTQTPAVIATPIRTVATPQQTPLSPSITSIPSSYSIKVGIVQFGNMHNGIDPMPAINKWKSWIEANSKFNITIIYNKYPQLDSNEIPQKGYWDDGTPNYFVYPKDLSDVHRALIPKDTIVNFVLWNNEGKSPSMAGAEFGYNQYDQFQPFLSIPIGLWWDDGPDQQWTYPLTSGMVHEFENAIFGIVNTWLKIPDMATPEGCGGYGYNSSNDPEWIKCRTYVLSTITDEMYQAILAYQAVLSSPTDKWVEKADTASAGGYGEAVVSTNNNIYTIRNLYASSNPEFWRYDPSTGSWSSIGTSGIPTGAFRNGAALAWDNGSYIYALPGARYPPNDVNRRLFYRYSITNNNWEQLADTPHAQGAGDAITWAGYDGYIYAIMGSAKHGTAFARYKYNSWENLTLNPNWTVTDDGASLAWTGGEYLYALRGEYAETVPNADFARYYIPSQTWVDMKDIPVTNGVGDGASLLYVRNYPDDIFALGGGDVNENPGYNFYSYSISTDSWGQLESIPCPIGYYVGNRLGFANGSIYYWQGAPTTERWICGGDAFYMFVKSSPPGAFDTGAGGYPSIMGAHNGTITLNQNLTVSRIYTYPSPGTGGHSEYVRIWNSTWNTTASWSGYTGDWHNITFAPFTLEANVTYNYTIRTGSYPQIIHNSTLSNDMGTIASTEFIDANGKHYPGWIPAIRLE